MQTTPDKHPFPIKGATEVYEVKKVAKPKPDYCVYVAGFMFSEDMQNVVLIRKNRPAWQAGKLNAVGGKVGLYNEPPIEDETPEQAMTREFEEETGVRYEGWEKFSVITGKDFRVFFFRAFTNECFNAVTKTDEPVEVYRMKDLFSKGISTIANLRWLLLLARDNEPTFTRISYS